MKQVKKRKAIFMPEDLYNTIKTTAQKNNRKIVDELRAKFPNPHTQ